MIDKIGNNQVPGLWDGQSARQPAQARPSQGAPADASLQINHAALIEKAVNSPTDDSDAVQRARRLMLSGQLDTPENIRQAAANIINFGV